MKRCNHLEYILGWALNCKKVGVDIRTQEKLAAVLVSPAFWLKRETLTHQEKTKLGDRNERQEF